MKAMSTYMEMDMTNHLVNHFVFDFLVNEKSKKKTCIESIFENHFVFKRFDIKSYENKFQE